MPRNANVGEPIEIIEIVPAEVPVPEPAPV
jgi:hypothetical protein